jgi:hypothetical protein
MGPTFENIRVGIRSPGGDLDENHSGQSSLATVWSRLKILITIPVYVNK